MTLPPIAMEPKPPNALQTFFAEEHDFLELLTQIIANSLYLLFKHKAKWFLTPALAMSGLYVGKYEVDTHSETSIKTEIIAIDSSDVLIARPEEIRHNGRLVGYTDPNIMVEKFANKPVLFVRNLATRRAFYFGPDEHFEDDILAKIGDGIQTNTNQPQ